MKSEDSWRIKGIENQGFFVPVTQKYDLPRSKLPHGSTNQKIRALRLAVAQKLIGLYHMVVSINGGTPKSSIYSKLFPYEPSIWGYPHDYGNPHI